MTAKIIRQHQMKDKSIYTQWSNGKFTCHYENDDEIGINGYIPYIKETDFENYPQYTIFMERIAHQAYNVNYKVARFEGLLPPLPPPVIKAKDYRKRKESTNEDE